jgi:hypothetical protein
MTETKTTNTEAPSILGSMPYDKAEKIMRAVLAVGFKAQDIGHENAKFPMDYSLEEICIASRMVSARNKEKMNRPGKHSMMMSMADRGIAHHYALAHYRNDPRDLLEAVGFTLTDPEDDDEDDDD